MSFAEFVHMGGHGLYVWLAYGSTIAVVVALWLSTRASGQRVRKELKMGLKRQSKV
ncbi:MAG: heme exporter protein CcmD [Proteobacteria bacterium]|nr:heme exporter protein CcmD [Pseudomonadota bacterium]